MERFRSSRQIIERLRKRLPRLNSPKETPEQVIDRWFQDPERRIHMEDTVFTLRQRAATFEKKFRDTGEGRYRDQALTAIQMSHMVRVRLNREDESQRDGF